MNIVRIDRDNAYSPDVEINEYGEVVYARDVKPGDLVAMPLHMWQTVLKPSRLAGAEVPEWLRSKDGLGDAR